MHLLFAVIKYSAFPNMEHLLPEQLLLHVLLVLVLFCKITWHRSHHRTGERTFATLRATFQNALIEQFIFKMTTPFCHNFVVDNKNRDNVTIFVPVPTLLECAKLIRTIAKFIQVCFCSWSLETRENWIKGRNWSSVVICKFYCRAINIDLKIVSRCSVFF